MEKASISEQASKVIQCGSMELQLWMLSEMLPAQQRDLIRNYMKIRDRLERRAVRRALRAQTRTHWRGFRK